MNPNQLLIFIVEDSDMYALLLERKLGIIDQIKFQRFTNGEECIKNLYHNPDLIILDYNLIGINGLETLKLIRNMYIRLGRTLSLLILGVLVHF